MTIKTLADLKKMRQASKGKVSLRENGICESDKIEVLVGMATCGIAAGAKETFLAFEKELEKNDIENVHIIKVGCIGYCHSEPTIQVNVPGETPLIYGNVTEKQVKKIVEKHLINHIKVDELIVETNFEKA